MKPILLFIIAIIATVSPLRAQDGLATAKAFQGGIVPREELVEVKVKGQPIRKYDLTLYHCVQFQADGAQQKKVEALVEADQKTALGSEVTFSNTRKTTIMQLPARAHLNRFLCYICEPDKVTLVYMEGHVKDIKQLKKAINDNH